MSDIWNGFRLVVVVIVLGIIAYFAAQAIPQFQSAATLPARIEADNARLLAESAAAKTFVELQITATRTAIENESLQAQAQANAQTIEAQGAADSARMTAQTWQGVAVGGMVIAGAFVAFLFVYLGLRLWFGQRLHHDAIHAAQKTGSTLLLPNGHEVRFLPSGQEPLNVSQNGKQKVIKEEVER